MRSGREAYGIGIAGPPAPWHGAFGGAGCSRNWHRETTRPTKALFGARVLAGCGIARHPGLKNNRITQEFGIVRVLSRNWRRDKKIDSRNWHRDKNRFTELAS